MREALFSRRESFHDVPFVAQQRAKGFANPAFVVNNEYGG
jgi:hypothetical protein